MGARVRRRETFGAGPARRLLRHVRACSRSALGRNGAGSARGQPGVALHRDVGAERGHGLGRLDRALAARGALVRRGTSLVLGLLIVAILAAAIIQFTIKM